MWKSKPLWIFVLVLASAVAADAAEDGDETLMRQKLVGWLGEVDNSVDRAHVDAFPTDFASDSIIGEDAPHPVQTERWVQQISWKPRAYLFRNFLNETEADYMVQVAMPQLKRSEVVSDSARGKKSQYRTSYGMFIRRNQDKIVKRIQERVSLWTHIPEINQEDIQMLRYTDGQQYRPHRDVLDEPEDGSRIATVLLYLNDCDEGGETTFPTDSEWIDAKLQDEMGPWSQCAKNHVSVKPRKGDALLFFSLYPDGKVDYAAEHAGCPVPEKFVKWTATIWIHTTPFRADTFDAPSNVFIMKDPGDCEDFHKDCQNWEKRGECKGNAEVLVGDLKGDGAMGICRKTCGICEVCAGDRECYLRNRKRAGYLFIEELWPEGGKRASVHLPDK